MVFKGFAVIGVLPDAVLRRIVFLFYGHAVTFSFGLNNGTTVSAFFGSTMAQAYDHKAQASASLSLSTSHPSSRHCRITAALAASRFRLLAEMKWARTLCTDASLTGMSCWFATARITP